MRDLRQGNQTALLKNLIIMQMPFVQFYLNHFSTVCMAERAKARGDLAPGNGPHRDSSICGQLSLCAGMCVRAPVFVHTATYLDPPISCWRSPRYDSHDTSAPKE